MKNSLVGVIVVTLLSVLFVPTQAQENKGTGLVGEWKPIKAVQAGKPAPVDFLQRLKFTFAENEITVTQPGQPADVNKYTIDNSKKPSQINITPVAGPEKGKIVQGIYKLEKDALTICYHLPDAKDAKRPTTFSAPKGSKRGMVVLKRVKKQ
ncbi:MAG: TIGR03067 domain-containing protein [Gemmataceae bacterium]